MTIQVPETLEQSEQFYTVKLKGASYVEYRQYREQKSIEVTLSTNLLAIILDGAKILHIDGVDYRIPKGNAVFLKKGTYFMSEVLCSEEGLYGSMLFFLKDQFLEDFIHELGIYPVDKLLANVRSDAKSPPSIFQLNVSPFLKAGLESLFPHFDHHHIHASSLVKLKLYEILLSILGSEAGDDFSHILNSIYSQKSDLISFMERSFIEPNSVSQYAKDSGRSLTAFKKEFSDTFHESPKKWVTRKRLERAHMLLTNTDRNVTEVSYDVGFVNLSNFITLFKKQYGVTPKQLQKA